MSPRGVPQTVKPARYTSSVAKNLDSIGSASVQNHLNALVE